MGATYEATAAEVSRRIGNTNDLRQRSLRPWVPSPLLHLPESEASSRGTCAEGREDVLTVCGDGCGRSNCKTPRRTTTRRSSSSRTASPLGSITTSTSCSGTGRGSRSEGAARLLLLKIILTIRRVYNGYVFGQAEIYPYQSPLITRRFRGTLKGNGLWIFRWKLTVFPRQISATTMAQECIDTAVPRSI
jgi:hypothetical protein